MNVIISSETMNTKQSKIIDKTSYLDYINYRSPMKEVVTLTEAKAKLSALINRVVVQKEKISITRKGKPTAIILPYEEYQKLCNQKKGGLLLAKEILADLDEEVGQMTQSIYKSREEALSREIPL